MLQAKVEVPALSQLENTGLLDLLSLTDDSFIWGLLSDKLEVLLAGLAFCKPYTTLAEHLGLILTVSLEDADFAIQVNTLACAIAADL